LWSGRIAGRRHETACLGRCVQRRPVGLGASGSGGIAYAYR
jgi:hypothetical protein